MLETAAFFRVEGTLTRRPTAATAAFMAANGPHLGGRISRLSGLAALAPFHLPTPLKDPTLATRVTWMAVRGLTEDRLAELGREYAERYLVPSLLPMASELIRTARGQGHRIVLLSDKVDAAVAPLAAHLGVDELVANRLELRDGRTTGRLLDPVISANLCVQWVRDFAAREGLDLGRSAAYAGRGEDALLLGQTGHPCAVSPDRPLRRLARDLDWPVVER
jgi:phosphoserine phosphatase